MTVSAESLPETDRLEQIYETIKARICTNEIGPGALIFETQIAEEYGVSRTPIRRIFARLEHDGLIRTRRGVGSYATALDVETVNDCYELRVHLSELIGDNVDRSAVAGTIERLEDLGRRASMLHDKVDYAAIGEVNIGVMRAILNSIRNQPLRDTLESLYMRTTRVWHAAIPDLDWAQEVDMVQAEINELLRALRVGDLMTYGHVRRNFTSLAQRRLMDRRSAEGPGR